jgi:hypothetical protein
MLYEAGARGSAHKHVDQLVQCSYLRYNSLSEYQAVAPLSSLHSLPPRRYKVGQLSTILSCDHVLSDLPRGRGRIRTVDGSSRPFVSSCNWRNTSSTARLNTKCIKSWPLPRKVMERGQANSRSCWIRRFGITRSGVSSKWTTASNHLSRVYRASRVTNV